MMCPANCVLFSVALCVLTGGSLAASGDSSLSDVLDSVKGMVDSVKEGASAADLANQANNLLNQASDVVDQAGNVVSDLANQAGNLAGDVAGGAQAMAELILKNTGFDVKDLPSELMQIGNSLFQLSSTPTFQAMLERIRGKAEKAPSMDAMQDGFKELLTETSFVQAAKDLMAEHNNDPNDPEFLVAFEALTQERLQAVWNGARAVSSSSALSLLAASVMATLVWR